MTRTSQRAKAPGWKNNENGCHEKNPNNIIVSEAVSEPMSLISALVTKISATVYYTLESISYKLSAPIMHENNRHDINESSVPRISPFELVCFSILIAIPLSSIAGWIYYFPVLSAYGSNYILMAPSTAIATLLLVGAYALRRKPARSSAFAIPFYSFIFLAVFLSVEPLLDTLSVTNFNLEQLLMQWREGFFPTPLRRMSEVTGFLMMMICLGHLSWNYAEQNRRSTWYNVAALLFAIPAITGLFFCYGYSFETPFFYRSAIKPMALPTSIVMMLFGIISFLRMKDRSPWLDFIMDQKLSSILIRTFVPLVLAIVLFEGIISAFPLHQFGNEATRHILLATVGAVAAILSTMYISRRISARYDQAQTEIQTALERIHTSEERYRAVFEQAGDYTFIMKKGTDGIPVILDLNTSAERALGYSRSELVGKPISFLDPDLNPHIAQERGRMLKQSPDAMFIVRHKRKNGSQFDVEVKTHSIHINEEECILAVERDITNLKHTEDALRQSKELYRNLFEQAGDHVLVLREQTDGVPIILDINESALKAHGYARDELLGKPISILEPGLSIETNRFRLDKVREGNELFTVRHRRKNGTWFESEVQSRMIQFGDETVVLAVERDITERTRSESALRESEKRYRLLFESSPVGILLVSRDGTIMEINSSLLTILGSPSIEATKSFNMLTFPPLVDAGVSSDLQKCFEGAGPCFRECRYTSKWGKSVILQYHLMPIMDELGKVGSIQMILNDITGRKRAEEEKEKMQAQLILSQKFESIGTLASGIAHDFNNILNAITGNAFLTLSAPDDMEKTKRNAESIIKSSERGAQLVKQLLSIARKSELNYEEININDLIREIAKLLLETFPKTITVEMDLNLDIAPTNLDPNQIHQVLLNLSVNARDAMQGKGVLKFKTAIVNKSKLAHRFIDVSFNNYIEFSVQDNGVGMDKKHREKIFQPFFTTKERGKGTGLGLSIVLGIIKNHQGFIEVESQPSIGSIFNVYLPITVFTPDTLKPDNTSRLETIRGTETILFVEDEDVVIDLAVEFFNNEGYRVLTAKSGPEALECYTQHRQEIAIVISDNGMPGFDGDILYQHLKSINSHVKFILTTGFIEGEKKKTLLNEGILEIVQKPYRLNELRNMIRTILDEG
jgi:PAS domain S-box-containing protein